MVDVVYIVKGLNGSRKVQMWCVIISTHVSGYWPITTVPFLSGYALLLVATVIVKGRSLYPGIQSLRSPLSVECWVCKGYLVWS
jgi:hypothetical protein